MERTDGRAILGIRFSRWPRSKITIHSDEAEFSIPKDGSGVGREDLEKGLDSSRLCRLVSQLEFPRWIAFSGRFDRKIWRQKNGTANNGMREKWDNRQFHWFKAIMLRKTIFLSSNLSVLFPVPIFCPPFFCQFPIRCFVCDKLLADLRIVLPRLLQFDAS